MSVQAMSGTCLHSQTDTRTRAPRVGHPLGQEVEPGRQDQDPCPGSALGRTFSWMTEMYQGTHFLG